MFWWYPFILQSYCEFGHNEYNGISIQASLRVIYIWIVVEIPVPIAILVCEGDLTTIKHIAKALKENIPVIIMKGSGKAADLVLDYIEK